MATFYCRRESSRCFSCCNKFYGQTWLNGHFNKDLERAKAELARQSSHHIMLQNKEYEIYPELWRSLNSAYKCLGEAVDPLTRNLDFTAGGDIQAWLDKSDFSTEEKEYFSAETDNSKAYFRIMKNRRLNESLASFIKFNDYFQSNKIFLSPDVKEKFNEIKKAIESAWVAEDLNHQFPYRKVEFDDITRAYDTFTKDIVPLMDSVEGVMQKKIFPQ